MSDSTNTFPDFNNCVIAILGLGYVGLPLAVSFSKTKKCCVTNARLERKVYGFDINEKRISQLKEGFDKTNEISKNDLISQSNLFFTHKIEDINEAEVFVITVPTPIDEFKEPDLSALKNVSKLVGSVMKSSKSNYCGERSGCC